MRHGHPQIRRGLRQTDVLYIKFEGYLEPEDAQVG